MCPRYLILVLSRSVPISVTHFVCERYVLGAVFLSFVSAAAVSGLGVFLEVEVCVH